jgi:SAM-dependent methyltransferase
LPHVEDRHFWFVARRERILSVLRRHVPDLAERALFDVGCGTGGLLSWLERSGLRVAGGCDAYPEGLRVARRRLVAPLFRVDLAGPPPLAAGQSLVGFFDVLEHLDDDRATLRWVSSILEPGGVLVLTVPAHPMLFDEADRLAHHRRRYRRWELAARLREAGFEVRYLGHFMALLVPGLLLARAVGRLLPGPLSDPARRRDAELRIVPGLNAALLLLLRLEAACGRFIPWPFGTSLLAVASRPRVADASGERGG